jgi:hypothetical protein
MEVWGKLGRGREEVVRCWKNVVAPGWMGDRSGRAVDRGPTSEELKGSGDDEQRMLRRGFLVASDGRKLESLSAVFPRTANDQREDRGRE